MQEPPAQPNNARRRPRAAGGTHALRVIVRGSVQGVGFRASIQRLALELGAVGWVRNRPDGSVEVHAEGSRTAVEELAAFLKTGPPGATVVELTREQVRPEGHEQFAIRGVAAGVFVVQEHVASTHHYDFRLQVDGVMRSWAVPKGPSLDPAVKRLAVAVPDHSPAHNDFEGPTSGGGDVIVWDRGTYEQGGRVAWPQALDRGHAVFVLHGVKLRGGFALQRTGSAPSNAQWLLIKRRDEEARPGSDIASERPESVLSGRRLPPSG